MATYTKEEVRAIAQMMNHAKGQGRPFAFLTGAGCSVTAGIPAAKGLLKAINKSGIGETIRQRLKTDDLAKCGYGEVMAYLNAEERKEIIGPFLENAKVNWGHLALACLMKDGFVSRVLTFNFDSVLARACGINGNYPAIYDFSQVPDAKGDFGYISHPAIVHLHGQGTSLAMMNSEEETRDHAQRLLPLFQDTFKRFDTIIVGYSGEADAAFAKIKEARSKDKRIYWCSRSTSPADHVTDLMNDCGKMGRDICEVNFDDLLIDLALELKCFPPPLFLQTAKHVLSEIKPIVEPPDGLRGAIGLLEAVSDKLARWTEDDESTETKLRTALFRDDHEAAIVLVESVRTESEKELLAWSYFNKGVDLGLSARAKGNDETLFRAAMAKYEQALKMKTDMHEALLNWGIALADLAEAKGNDEELFREAMAKYEQSLNIKPDKHEALFNWGNALAELAEPKGNDEELFREAMTKYEHALNIKPDKHEALYNWGNVLAFLAKAKGNDEALLREAMAKYEQSLNIKPDKHEALLNWGNALAFLAKAKGNDEALLREAMAKYEQAVIIKPDMHEALYNWGTVLAGLAKAKGSDEALFCEAMTKYEQALNIKPDKHEALYNWGTVLTDLAKAKGNDEVLFREAMVKFEQALNIIPDMQEAFFNWGNVLAGLALAKGRDEALLREAMAKYEQAVIIDPDMHEAIYNWGTILAGLAKAKGSDEALFREAMTKYERALYIKPDKHEALYNWGNVLADLAKAKGNDEALFREAFTKYEQALKIKPEMHDALNSWVAATTGLFHKIRQADMLVEAHEKAERAQQLEGKANYNLACVLALQGLEQECAAQLLRCKADGTLPEPAHLLTDLDLAAYRDRDWFKALALPTHP